jgi:hypothetical protein
MRYTLAERVRIGQLKDKGLTQREAESIVLAHRARPQQRLLLERMAQRAVNKINAADLRQNIVIDR